jgi:hypothetical protein
MNADLIIVDEADDVFSALFASYACAHGRDAQRFRPDAFARAITIDHDPEAEDGPVDVTPAVPLLLRPLAGGTSAIEEDRFVWNEAFAAVWAAAALTPQVVVNRPNEWGWGSRSAFCASLTDLRRGADVCAPEVFWRGLAPEDSGELLHQELRRWRTLEPGALDAGPSDLPVRSRRLGPCLGWEQVVVVGSHAFRVTETDLGDHAVEADSISAAAGLALSFACVSWAVGQDGPPRLVRVNPFPNLQECRPVLDDVFEALLKELTA